MNNGYPKIVAFPSFKKSESYLMVRELIKNFDERKISQICHHEYLRKEDLIQTQRIHVNRDADIGLL